MTALVTFAAQRPVQDLKAAYDQVGPVNVTFDTSPNITKRLASGEMPDILVAQSSTIDDMLRAGCAIAATRRPIGRIGVGVAMGRGWTGANCESAPDVSNTEALEASILKADSIVYSRGASGLIVEAMLRELGASDQTKNKTIVVPTGADVMQRLGEECHSNQIGFTMISEIKLGEMYGGKLVGPLPSALQVYTQYEAVVMSSANSPDVAKRFIAAIASPAALKVFTAAGWN